MMGNETICGEKRTKTSNAWLLRDKERNPTTISPKTTNKEIRKTNDLFFHLNSPSPHLLPHITTPAQKNIKQYTKNTPPSDNGEILTKELEQNSFFAHPVTKHTGLVLHTNLFFSLPSLCFFLSLPPF